MRILLWAPYGAGTHYWGPGTSAFRLYQNGLPEGCTVTLVHASKYQDDFSDVFVEQIKLPVLEGSGILGKVRYHIAASRWIKAHGKNYDIVHGLTAFEYTFRPMLQFERIGIPVIIKITGEHSGLSNNSTLSKLLGVAKARKRDLPKISGFVAISDVIEQKLLSSGIIRSKIHKIPNGVDLEKFKPLNEGDKVVLRRKLGLSNIFTFVYIGGLTYNKRVIEIVKSTMCLLESGSLIQTIVVGPDRSNGAVLKEIEKLIEAGQCGDKVLLIPKTNTPEVYLQAADVFLLPSKSEGMSNALLEAMACGLPSIVTPISGSTDLIKDKVNGLYTNGCVDDITLKMGLLYNDVTTSTKLGHKGRTTVKENYASSFILKRHLDVFKAVCKTIKTKHSS